MRILMSKHRFLVTIGAMVAAIVLVLGGAAAKIIPIPLPDLSLAQGASALSPVSPPGSTLPPYLMTVPALAGKVLHWQQNSYFYITGNKDPANGQVVAQDIWEQIGADGVPTKFHAVNALPDGSFHQEVVETPDTVAVIRGPAYAAISSAPPCPSPTAWSPPRAKLLGLLPSFVNETSLSQAGFQENGSLTKPLPSTVSLAGVRPMLQYGSENSAQRWVLNQSTNSITTTQELEIGAQGRVVETGSDQTNTANNTVNETWKTYGALEVYDPGSVPASVFTLSQQASEVCHD